MKTLENIAVQNNRGWHTLISAGSTLIAVLLPKCPLCAMAILSIFGLSANFDPRIYFTLTFIFILLALTVTALRAKKNRAYRPLYLAIIASVLILAGKFYVSSSPAVFYAGEVLFVVAILWNGYSSPAAKCHTKCRC